MLVGPESENVRLLLQLDLERLLGGALPGGVAPAADAHRKILEGLADVVRKVGVMESLRHLDAYGPVAVDTVVQALDHVLYGAL